MSGKSVFMRVSREAVATAHKVVARNLGEKVGDRAAVELCIEGMSDAGIERIADAVNTRNRIVIAANTLSALQYFNPDLAFDLIFADDGAWHIVRPGQTEGWPLGKIPRAEMDEAMQAAGLETPQAH